MAAGRARALGRNRNYLLLWSGQAVSAVGTSMTELAFPLLVLAQGHSAAAAGFVGALHALPYLVLILPAGALVDRWDRKRMMVLCDAGRALCLGSIPLALVFGRLALGQIYLVALVEGMLAVFFGLAEASSLPRVVPAGQLADAVTVSEVTEGAVALAGPSLGGLLFTAGRALPFLGDAASYAASAASLLAIRIPFQAPRERPRRRIHREVAEGIAWLWRQPFLRAMTLLYAGAALVLPGTGLLIIVLAQRQHGSAAVIGLIFAGEGIGTLLGAGLGSWAQRRLPIGWAVIGVRSAIALLWPLLALAPNPLALGAVAFGFGLIDPIEDVPYFSYRHLLIPDALKGRVLSVCRLGPALTRPLGLALIGVLIHRIGAIDVVLVTWAWLAALALATALSPGIRNAPRLAEAVAV